MEDRGDSPLSRADVLRVSPAPSRAAPAGPSPSGSTGTHVDLISRYFGGGPAEAAPVTPASITPMGNLPSEAPGWTVSDCNYAMDFLSVDAQLDGASALVNSWYADWAGDWTLALQVAKDYCYGVRERSAGTVTAVVGYLEAAEQYHVAAYGGVTDGWDLDGGTATWPSLSSSSACP